MFKKKNCNHDFQPRYDTIYPKFEDQFIKLAEKSVAGELVHYSNVKGDIRY